MVLYQKFMQVDSTGAEVAGTPASLGQQAAAASTSVVPASDATFNTELPAAAALTDADANPTVPGVGAYLMAWDGTQMRRVKVGATANNPGGLFISPMATSAGDAFAGTPGAMFRNDGNSMLLVSAGYLFNETNYDRPRGNTNKTILSSAARTATPTKVDQTNHNARSLILVIDCTVYPASASVVFTIQGKDEASGKYYTILASAAITGTGTTVLRVSPHYAADVANLVKIDTLPRTWAVDAVHTGGDSITYSVGAALSL